MHLNKSWYSPYQWAAQSRRGVVRILEVQVHPLVEAILRFIQLRKLLPPLKPMAQSRRGVVQMPEAQVHPLVVAILRFIQILGIAPISGRTCASTL
jgi:hypothetical protein